MREFLTFKLYYLESTNIWEWFGGVCVGFGWLEIMFLAKPERSPRWGMNSCRGEHEFSRGILGFRRVSRQGLLGLSRRAARWLARRGKAFMAFCGEALFCDVLGLLNCLMYPNTLGMTRVEYRLLYGDLGGHLGCWISGCLVLIPVGFVIRLTVR